MQICRPEGRVWGKPYIVSSVNPDAFGTPDSFNSIKACEYLPRPGISGAAWETTMRGPQREREDPSFFEGMLNVHLLTLCLSVYLFVVLSTLSAPVRLSRLSLSLLSLSLLARSSRLSAFLPPLVPLSLCSPALDLSLASSFAFPPPSHPVSDLHEKLDISKFPSSIFYLNQESPNLGPRNGSTHQASAAELHRAFQQGDTGVQGPI